jgi:hypothetical protein
MQESTSSEAAPRYKGQRKKPALELQAGQRYCKIIRTIIIIIRIV